MSITPMGIGTLGQREVRFIRKFRWQLSGEFAAGKIEPTFIKLSSRPNMDESNSVTTTFFNITPITPIATHFMDGGVVAPYKRSANHWIQRNQKKHYGTLKLVLFDGCGVSLEEWDLDGVFPTSINFGELDYSSSDETMAETVWKYHSCRLRADKPSSYNYCD